MIDFAMPRQLCPVCRYSFDAATRIEGDGPPEPGSLTLCINCGSILQWDFKMQLHALTVQEVRELPIQTFALLARAQRLLHVTKVERN